MSNKKLVGGVWVPTNETHLIGVLESTAAENNGRGSYQLNTIGAFLDYIPQDRRDVLVDIGGHVGLWSMWLARYFQNIIAYEPIPVLQECFALNVWQDGKKNANVELRKFALGDQTRDIDLSFELDNSGHTHVLPSDEEKHIPAASLVRASMRRLDDEGIASVGAIKIDVEGFELAVLRGAEETIRKNKPIICMEQKPHGSYGWEQYDATRLLMTWGAKPIKRVIDDFIFVWE